MEGDRICLNATSGLSTEVSSFCEVSFTWNYIFEMVETNMCSALGACDQRVLGQLKSDQ